MSRFTITSPDGVTYTMSLNQVAIRVSADGYVRSCTPYGKHMELILTFDQVIAAMQEERDLWK